MITIPHSASLRRRFDLFDDSRRQGIRECAVPTDSKEY